MRRQFVVKVAVLVFVCFAGAVADARAADQPLSKDDVVLLLIGGATTDKMVALIERRGVDFQMNPDLAKKFHDGGAADAVIEALTLAGEKARAAVAAGQNSQPAVPETTAPAGAAKAAVPAPPKATEAPRETSVQQKIREALAADPSANPPAAAKAASAGAVDLSDPSPERIQQIVQEFAAKEKLFRLARDNYAYHQINKVQELDVDGAVVGMYEQDWDITYDDSGKRVEQVTYAPPDSLKGLLVTQEDLNSMRNVQPFVLSTEELPEYETRYLGHVKVDEITAYVFNIRPKEIVKGRQYFQGIVWVDDRDLQIVKTQGKIVPETRSKKGQFNLFPRFITYREQIDGKFWFPTYTIADDTLYFPGNPVHVKEVIRYTDYKQFKSTSTFKVVKEVPVEKPKATPAPASKASPQP